ncbi:MAG: zinc ribbon domain-containing protein [Acutalibacteraceae bacterium]|nr:zinc ribbon domain-containing protein [Acutalibacteraceae bacterium]
MRCKNCKKEINPNFFKCPHCGKPIKHKKKRDGAELALTAGFFGVGALFVILTFFSLFFTCAYYSEIAMIIAVIVFLICVPFIFGNYQGLSQRASEILGAVVSLPFIGNWLAVVVFAKVSVNYGGLSNAYYIYTIAALVLVDVILLLRAAGILKKPLILAWISLALGIISVVFTLVYFLYSGVAKGFAVTIITVQALLPEYMAFHILMTDYRKEISK